MNSIGVVSQAMHIWMTEVGDCDWFANFYRIWSTLARDKSHVNHEFVGVLWGCFGEYLLILLGCFSVVWWWTRGYIVADEIFLIWTDAWTRDWWRMLENRTSWKVITVVKLSWPLSGIPTCCWWIVFTSRWVFYKYQLLIHMVCICGTIEACCVYAQTSIAVSGHKGATYTSSDGHGKHT